MQARSYIATPIAGRQELRNDKRIELAEAS
jgi:hypothetical protein